MKFSAAIITAVAFAPLAQAAGGYPVGFVEQCCIPDDTRRGRQLAGFKGLNGYDAATGTIDDRCTTPNPPGYTCYTYKQVCEGGTAPDYIFTPTGTPSTKPNVCNNRANCHANGVDPECIGGNANEFPDIEWGCKFGDRDAYLCGYMCKFTDACGDPHFETWDGQWYDYHGECDLVLIKTPEFGQGTGLNIHVRTKARYEYSYIESAALQIGEDVLEVGSWGQYFYNGVEGADLSAAMMAGKYPIDFDNSDPTNTRFKIHTGGSENIELKAFKDLVSVKTNNSTMYNFGSSSGMMGDYLEGKMLARDGTTIITDPNDMGAEWQVRQEEPQLFQTMRAPQHPFTCTMPTKTAGVESRRLAGSEISKDAAEAACAHAEGSQKTNCVFDVMATGDVDVAGTY